jgi:hypothetical protein
MNQSRRTFVKSVAAVTAAGAAIDSHSATVKASKKLTSASAMVIASDGKLIVADWRAGALVALSLPALPVAKERSFNVLNVADRLADVYKLDTAKIRITASAFHTESQTAILAVSLGKQVDSPIAIALMDAGGKVKNISIDAAVTATQPLLQQPNDTALWGKQSTRTLLVTDMKFYPAPRSLSIHW